MVIDRLAPLERSQLRLAAELDAVRFRADTALAGLAEPNRRLPLQVRGSFFAAVRFVAGADTRSVTDIQAIRAVLRGSGILQVGGAVTLSE